ncbi:hypothetical protein VTO42DRAFT_7685 [Malbranchea cinnamomea]
MWNTHLNWSFLRDITIKSLRKSSLSYVNMSAKNADPQQLAALTQTYSGYTGQPNGVLAPIPQRPAVPLVPVGLPPEPTPTTTPEIPAPPQPRYAQCQPRNPQLQAQRPNFIPLCTNPYVNGSKPFIRGEHLVCVTCGELNHTSNCTGILLPMDEQRVLR